MKLKQIENRKIIWNFVTENPQKTKAEIVKKFKGLIPPRTVYDVLKNIQVNGTIDRKAGSGRPTTLNNPRVRSKLLRETVGRVAKSYRALGRELGAHHKTVKKHLESEGVKRKARKKRPKTSPKQVKTQKVRLNKLRHKIRKCDNVEFIMDDESYFTIDGNEWQENSYYDDGRVEINDETRYVSAAKYPQKVLVWLAISSKGMSKPLFLPRGLAVDKETYSTMCLPQVKAFIRKYHQNDNVLFWPDLASAHYAGYTLEKMKKLKIPYMDKNLNPPNVPQIRPIEDLWAIIKRRVYEGNFVAKDIKQLTNKIRSVLRKIEKPLFQKLMGNLPKKVRKAARSGVNHFIH